MLLIYTLFFIDFIEGLGSPACKKTVDLQPNQIITCQNYYLGMQTNLFCTPSTASSKRGSSLPNKIKIKTCKLPKDFFQARTVQLLKVKSRCQSRESTEDEENYHPRTPSFKEQHEHRRHSRNYRKAETARIIPADSTCIKPLTRQQSHSIRRKLTRQVNQRFPILLLPPINSSRVFMGF